MTWPKHIQVIPPKKDDHGRVNWIAKLSPVRQDQLYWMFKEEKTVKLGLYLQSNDKHGSRVEFFQFDKVKEACEWMEFWFNDHNHILKARESAKDSW